jgi:hypothetical protein
MGACEALHSQNIRCICILAFSRVVFMIPGTAGLDHNFGRNRHVLGSARAQSPAPEVAPVVAGRVEATLKDVRPESLSRPTERKLTGDIQTGIEPISIGCPPVS